jgi:large subunit ribosomal protein L21
VVDHLKGPKVLSFKYRPKKRIRVRGGNRAHFTRLAIDFIGKSGDKKEKPKAEPKPKAEKPAKAEKEAKPKASTTKKSTSPKKSEKK